MIKPASTPVKAGPPLFDCHISDNAYGTLLTLRGPADHAGFAAAVQQATGLILPTAINGVARAEDQQLFCHGPDEWAFYQRAADTSVFEHLCQVLRNEGAKQGFAASVVDNSSGFTHFLLSGPDAYLLLQTGCPLDLHPQAFPSGSMAQSHFHKANVTLYCSQAGTAFEVTVRRSFARYVHDYWRASLS